MAKIQIICPIYNKNGNIEISEEIVVNLF